jgi:hypothetical protein
MLKPYHFWMSAYLARELVKNKSVDVDKAIIALLKKSESHNEKNANYSSDLEKIGTWKTIFAPDAAINSFIKK